MPVDRFRATANRGALAVLCSTLAVAALLLATALPARADVKWRSGPTPRALPMSRAELETAVGRLAARPEARHVVVQFAGPMTQTQREALAARGLRLLSPLGDHAWFAALERGEQASRVVEAGGLTLLRIDPIETVHKLHPDLARGEIRPWTVVPAPTPEAEKGKPDKPSDPSAVPIVAVSVMLHADADVARVARPLVARHGGTIVSIVRSINAVTVHLPADRVAGLASEDDVMWVEPPLPVLTEINDSNRSRVGAEIVNDPPYGLDGSGVQVLVYDGGKVFAHGDLAGRLTIGASDTSGISDHATHVAGTIGGDGAGSAGLYRGMAPGVDIISYGFEQEGGLQQGFLYTDPGDIEADYGEAIATYGADIANNSIGTNTAANGFPCEWEGNYGATGALIDAIARGSLGEPFRIVWANGNERGSGRCGSTYLTTAPPSCAKNHITVGAMNSNDDSVTWFTSWGPCDDGRMKPDVSGPGCESGSDGGVTSLSSSGGYSVKCGTSMSSPTVAGVGALVIQAFRQAFPERPDPRNSTLKAVLANTAVDIEAPGPDYRSGFGSVRVQPAVDTILEERFLEAEIAQNETYAFIVIVDPDDTELRVTLAWDDVPGTPNVDPVLVNDLDLRVIGPDATVHLPWTLDPANPGLAAVNTQRDGVNNAEQVRIDEPLPGAYRVEVVGFNIAEGPTQTFSVAASPSLINCAPEGNLGSDRRRVTCDGSLVLRVIDCDLNTDDAVIDTTTVSVVSDSDTSGETVLLTESAPESATLLGSIDVAVSDAPGVVQVAEGDTVTITYIDADDGAGGINVPVSIGVVVDCTAPQFLSVTTTEVKPRDATIGIDLDEPARVTVHHGLSCGALDQSAVSFRLEDQHTVNLKGLTDDTTYFYAVEAEDEAGNVVVDDAGGLCHTFTTPMIPDFFTEQFSAGLDLVGQTMTFFPGDPVDFYAPCLEPNGGLLPTDPAGGTSLGLGDDQPGSFVLSDGATVSLYGVAYDTVFVGPNGYVTFGSGDSTYTESFSAHFSKPRVAALFDDLNPAAGGSVTWKQLSDRVAVTWDAVPEYNTSNSNTFQIELFFNGTIRVSWLTIAVADAVVGLSSGGGQDPDFLASDLSGYGSCGPRPPVVSNLAVTTDVDTPAAIALSGSDDGLPGPPALLTWSIVRLPSFGTLVDDGSGMTIASIPWVLVDGGNAVTYQPQAGARGWDSFDFLADDGGTAPDGGSSAKANVGITIGLPVVVAEYMTDDVDPGWTATGMWAFGSPTGGGSHNGDPVGGATGANVYGYNLAGDYPNNMAVETLTTTAIDLSSSVNTVVEFQRWLGIESSSYDHATFEISTDGLAWSPLWTHSGASIDENAWSLQSFDISAVADGQAAVQLRWTMGTTDGSVTYPGWNVDDVRVIGNPPAVCAGMPAEVPGLTFEPDRQTLRWSAAAYLGGTTPVYDLLRSDDPGDFDAGATCTASASAATTAGDADLPLPGQLFSYLVRAVNECGTGSVGDGRVARDCP